MMSISNLLISNAYADGAVPAVGGGIMDFIPLIAMVGVFYFLVLRPQMKRSKEMKIMIAALQKGDEVVTTGGVIGTVTKVGESYVGVDVADGINLTVQKGAIQTVLPKGTIKSAS
ncbi:MAG: preprotein translocase subunit YajC [Gallionellaceae bacterium]|jgi:preprotein translocase subunit YajC